MTTLSEISGHSGHNGHNGHNGRTSEPPPGDSEELTPAHADCPGMILSGLGLVALGTAGGLVVAGGLIAVAIMLDDKPIIAPGTRIAVPGTPPSKRRLSGQDLPPAAQAFLDRDIMISAASSEASGTDGDSEASVRANYMFDGDVRNAPPRLGSFTSRDQLTFRLEISDVEESHNVPVTFSVDNLVLSTIDSPETNGHAAIAFVASQDDQVLWRWSARVSQGQKPEITVPSGGSQRVVREQNDLLIIRNLRMPVEYTTPGAGSSTVVEVVMSTEGVGART